MDSDSNAGGSRAGRKVTMTQLMSSLGWGEDKKRLMEWLNSVEILALYDQYHLFCPKNNSRSKGEDKIVDEATRIIRHRDFKSLPAFFRAEEAKKQKWEQWQHATRFVWCFTDIQMNLGGVWEHIPNDEIRGKCAIAYDVLRYMRANHGQFVGGEADIPEEDEEAPSGPDFSNELDPRLHIPISITEDEWVGLITPLGRIGPVDGGMRVVKLLPDHVADNFRYHGRVPTRLRAEVGLCKKQNGRSLRLNEEKYELLVRLSEESRPFGTDVAGSMMKEEDAKDNQLAIISEIIAEANE